MKLRSAPCCRARNIALCLPLNGNLKCYVWYRKWCWKWREFDDKRALEDGHMHTHTNYKKWTIFLYYTKTMKSSCGLNAHWERFTKPTFNIHTIVNIWQGKKTSNEQQWRLPSIVQSTSQSGGTGLHALCKRRSGKQRYIARKTSTCNLLCIQA